MKTFILSVAAVALFLSGCGKKDTPQPPQPVVPTPPIAYIDTFDCTVHRVYHEIPGVELDTVYDIKIDSLYSSQLIVDRAKPDSIFISSAAQEENARFLRTSDGKYHHTIRWKGDWEQTFFISADSISAVYKLICSTPGIYMNDVRTFTGLKKK